MMLSVAPLLLLAVAASTDVQTYPRANLLVEATDLMRPDSADKFQIVDARSREKYKAGHIPGAVWVNHEEWSRAFASTQDPSAWKRRLDALGIGAGRPVVIYDDKRSNDAARIWWILRYWGVNDARLLNGGWQAWQAAGGPVSTEPAKPQASTIALSAQPDRLATKGQLLDELPQKTWQIVDARSKDEFCGKLEMAKRSGAIPGAVHLEWSDLIDSKTQRFKSAAELARIFKEAGVDLSKPTVTHCQSGGRSSVMAFAMELMGARSVRNYYRSWAEWGNADDTPIVKPPAGK